jgi:hypothetical protein
MKGRYRRYGSIDLVIEPRPDYTWYAVIGRNGVLLQFAIYNDGQRRHRAN